MKVFKFGGATVNSATAVKQVKSIIDHSVDEDLVVVISAMGKTTNRLEGLVRALYHRKLESYTMQLMDIQKYHLEIIGDLFDDKDHPIFRETKTIFGKLSAQMEKRMPENYNFLYDQIVSLGEILSTKIVAAYLSCYRDNICWKDARAFLRTDNRYRAASVNWNKTQELINKELRDKKGCTTYVTQGFIGHTEEGFPTTLGREGSDFTAGIIAYCSDAESVTIWKDVPGMFNADPKVFKESVKLDKISYKELIELSYYGASVVHPKTVQPLQNKNIPLYIKSFLDPHNSGTVVQHSTDGDKLVPSFIFKPGQLLLSMTTRDFSFVVEENLSDIFKKIALAGAHINVMQNSAVSFSACMEIDDLGLKKLLKSLQEEYEVRYNRDVELVTIRHYDQETLDRITQKREILMEQKTRETARIVMLNR